MKKQIRIAILASGTGQLFGCCVEHFKDAVDFSLITSPVNLGASEVAKKLGVPVFTLDFKVDASQHNLLRTLNDLAPDLILSLGFKYKISDEIVSHFAGRIWNSHPSLLPKYGGKGMYGSRVHQAVFRNEEPQSGFTIHEVTSELDRGRILVQEVVSVEGAQSPEEVESIVKSFERKRLPLALEHLISTNLASQDRT